MIPSWSLTSLAFPVDGHTHSPRLKRRASASIIFLFLLLLRASVVMAWFCSGRSNTELVQRLHSAHVITSERVKEVRVCVAREGSGNGGRKG